MLSRATYSALAGVELKRIEGSYHFMLDQPDAFLSEVGAFPGRPEGRK